MYLSQLNLKRLDRSTMKALGDIYRLHQTIMKGFISCTETDRVLFRVEPEERNGMATILVQSQQEPDWSLLTEERQGVVTAKVKEYNVTFNTGQQFNFRLRANPTVTRDGKRYGLIRDESLVDWLEKKQERLGVQFVSVVALDEGYINGLREKDTRRMNIKSARFEGTLKVVNPTIFSETLATGIGPAKAFGCGLLSLARV